MAKVMVGMSGGVDSSVAALLLKNNGYDVTGVTLKLFEGDQSDDFTKTCCSLKDVEDARSVCYRLGIEHLVFNFKGDFSHKVIDSFINSYLNGETPNPCIECNRHIKFDKMLRRAQELGYDYIATGHYAVRDFDENTGKYVLRRPADRSKDQTYVLYALTQQQLAKTLFPLGGYTKKDIRRIAGEVGLANSEKPDSQDICFVPDGDYVSFIRRNSNAVSAGGDFVDMNGNVVGRHSGIINYTIGQRRGTGLAFGRPVYVTDKNPADNTVTVGEEKDLYKQEIIAGDVNLISLDRVPDGLRVTAKIRYSRNEQPAILKTLENGDISVYFEKPQRAPAKGQAVVFYDNDIVVGGGIIR